MISPGGMDDPPWARATDGSAQITFTKPFSSPRGDRDRAGAQRHCGPAPRCHGAARRGHVLHHLLDDRHPRSAGPADRPDRRPGRRGSLLAQSVDAGAVDQSLLADLRDSFGLTVKVELPGGTTVTKGTAGQATTVDASTSVLDTTKVILVTVAVALVVLAIVVLLWPRRRRRRRATRSRRYTPAE